MNEVNRTLAHESVLPTAPLAAQQFHMVESVWSQADQMRQRGVHSPSGLCCGWTLIHDRGQKVVWSDKTLILRDVSETGTEPLAEWTLPYAIEGVQIALPHLLTWGDRGAHLIHLNSQNARLLQETQLTRPAGMQLSDQYVAGWGSDGPTVYVWNVESGDLVHSLTSGDPSDFPKDASFIRRDKILVGFSKGGPRTWDLNAIDCEIDCDAVTHLGWGWRHQSIFQPGLKPGWPY